MYPVNYDFCFGKYFFILNQIATAPQNLNNTAHNHKCYELPDYYAILYLYYFYNRTSSLFDFGSQINFVFRRID